MSAHQWLGVAVLVSPIVAVFTWAFFEDVEAAFWALGIIAACSVIAFVGVGLLTGEIR